MIDSYFLEIQIKAEIAFLALDPVILTADQSIILFFDVLINFINLF